MIFINNTSSSSLLSDYVNNKFCYWVTCACHGNKSTLTVCVHSSLIHLLCGVPDII